MRIYDAPYFEGDTSQPCPVEQNAHAAKRQRGSTKTLKAPAPNLFNRKRKAPLSKHEIQIAKKMVQSAFKEMEKTEGMTQDEMWIQVAEDYNEHAIQQVVQHGNDMSEGQVDGLIDALTTATILKKWWVDSRKRATQIRLQNQLQDVWVDATSAANMWVIPDEAALMVSTPTSDGDGPSQDDNVRLILTLFYDVY